MRKVRSDSLKLCFDATRDTQTRSVGVFTNPVKPKLRVQDNDKIDPSCLTYSVQR